MNSSILAPALALGVACAPLAANPTSYGKLRTPWADQVSQELPLPEYPRPQLIREQNWTNLNGQWNFAVAAAGSSRPERWEGKILVPFAIESQLSGVGRMVSPDQELWYHRSFERPAGERVLLHFGAVDWRATVWVNGTEVGMNEGGFHPFSFDITEALKPRGDQDLVVRVWDPTNTEPLPRGKQVLKPEGIFYTAVTGIWQTVWLEGVPRRSIAQVMPVADLAAGLVRITVEGRGVQSDDRVHIAVYHGGRPISRAEGPIGVPLEVPMPDAKLWSPDTPHLYDLQVTLASSGDVVKSYFAMREISFGPDEYGTQRMLLNGQPLFHYGFLDQGWWPDGLYTAPTDEALRWDIVKTREMGFNMARKHVKVEPARWYRHADELGLLVWQDMPHGYNHGSQQARQGSGREGIMPEPWSSNFQRELKLMIDSLRFFPSIVVWVPFNEGWGQHRTNEILQWTAAYDPTRLVNGPSGWEDMGWGHLKDMHAYPGPGMFPAMPDRVSVLGEFGGLGLVVPGHLWQEDRNWGYQNLSTKEALLARYRQLVQDLHPLIENGLAAAVYTQTTDVEGEVNGMITYDRRVMKIDPATLAELHRPLYLPHQLMVDIPVVPSAETEAVEWLYTTSRPAAGWEQPSFPSASWQRGRGGFGTRGTPNAIVGTEWNTADIWLRREFELKAEDLENLSLRIHHDEDATIFINGIEVASLSGYTTGYRTTGLDPDLLRRALRAGRNVVAIHCRQTEGGQYIDFGLVRRVPAPLPAAISR
jgi:hypothetical protein